MFTKIDFVPKCISRLDWETSDLVHTCFSFRDFLMGGVSWLQRKAGER